MERRGLLTNLWESRKRSRLDLADFFKFSVICLLFTRIFIKQIGIDQTHVVTDFSRFRRVSQFLIFANLQIFAKFQVLFSTICGRFSKWIGFILCHFSNTLSMFSNLIWFCEWLTSFTQILLKSLEQNTASLDFQSFMTCFCHYQRQHTKFDWFQVQ